MKRFVRFILVIFVFCFIFQQLIPTAIEAQQENSATDSAVSASLTLSPTPIPPNPDPLNLTVSPVSLLLETDPGKPVSSSVQVMNNGEKDEYLTFKLMTFDADRTGSQPVLREFREDEEQQNWMTISPNTFLLPPKQWKTIQVDFSPPADAALSYYYALTIMRQNPQQAEEGESTIIGAPAILSLVTVNSPYAHQELQLLNFRTTKRIYEYLPVNFEIEVENKGNIHLAPVGNIFIDGPNLPEDANLTINRTNGLILPNTSRTYELSWDEGFPVYEKVTSGDQVVTDEAGNPKWKLKWDFSKAHLFRMGRYTAQLIFIYDDGERDIPTEATVVFWVIPWKLLLAFFTIVLLVVVGISLPIVIVVRYMRRQKHNSPEAKSHEK